MNSVSINSEHSSVKTVKNVWKATIQSRYVWKPVVSVLIYNNIQWAYMICEKHVFS